MGNFLINENEKKRILMLHQTATKSHYIFEQEEEEIDIDDMELERPDLPGVKVKLFNDDTKSDLFDMGTITNLYQSSGFIGLDYMSTSGKKIASSNLNFFCSKSNGEVIFYDGSNSMTKKYFSDEITDKLKELCKENPNSEPIKADVLKLGVLNSVIYIDNPNVVGTDVEFDYTLFTSNEQNNMDSKFEFKDFSDPEKIGRFSCKTKRVTLDNTEFDFSSAVTSKMMEYCDEYSMNNMDFEDDEEFA